MTQTNSIPASQVVAVRPNVLSAGGTSLDVIGLILTTNTRVPIGTVQPFATLADVQTFFGSSTHEADVAAVYFRGYNGSPVTPDSLLFAQYPSAAVSAYLRGGNVSGLTVAQLQAITGTLNASIDGYTYPIASLDLSAAASFSAAAATIQTGLNATKPVQGSATGSTAGTVFTAASALTGAFAVGQVLSGGTMAANTYILAQLTGPVGGLGTYTISVSQTVTSTTISSKGRDVAVAYDSQSGAFTITSGNTGAVSLAGFATGTSAAALMLTSATGAVTSQGAAIATPEAFMNALILVNQDWVTFMLAFNADVSGNANKLLFAKWTNTQDNQFAFVCWDTDITPTAAVPATGSLGYLIAQAQYSGTFLIWEPSDLFHAPFVCGTAASIDFTRTAGRITFKFKRQDGLSPGVTNATVASNLAANGYNFYGGYATRNQDFNFLANGVVSGEFTWFDTYINQIWLNNELQLAILTGMTEVGSIPYNSSGYGLIEAFCMDPINAALNFGAIQPGVTLSAAQVAEVNQSAGAIIASTLQTRGWYLQVKDAAPSVRAVRGSPPCTLWYMDGGSIQKIELDSIEVQ